MTRIVAITAAHREHLRQLKVDFDRAYDAIEDLSDRSSRSFLEAEACYRKWLKAIDAHAIALLDDLDALDIGGGGPRPEPPLRGPSSPVAPVSPGEVDHVFSEMTDMLLVRDLIEEELVRTR